MAVLYDRIDSNKNKTYLLFAVFFVIVISIGWIFGEVYGIGFWGAIIAFCIASVMAFVSYYSSDSIALSVNGAIPADEKKYLVLHDTVEGLAIAAGIPKPRVYVIEDGAINAFATGRDPQHSAVVVTTGALTRLNKLELEGVIAHELSHVKNRDILVMTMAVVLVGVIALLSDFMIRSMWYGRGGSSRDGGRLGLVFVLVGLGLALLAPVIGGLFKMAISRNREFLADADGALLTRYPEGLANALQKISVDTDPLDRANTATAHLFFANPFKKRAWMASLFNTHPPIEERIKSLRQMAYMER